MQYTDSGIVRLEVELVRMEWGHMNKGMQVVEMGCNDIGGGTGTY